MAFGVNSSIAGEIAQKPSASLGGFGLVLLLVVEWGGIRLGCNRALGIHLEFGLLGKHLEIDIGHLG